jgi:elongation factor G
MVIVVPNDHIRDIMADINSRLGNIHGIDMIDDTQIILPYLPMAEVLTYVADLNAMTCRQGLFLIKV